MWDGLLILLLLSIVMATASFLAGALPLSFTLSPRQLRLLTAFGTGVLVGTSLIVIIPEGVETLYATAESSHSHNARSLSLQARTAIPQAQLSPGIWSRQVGTPGVDGEKHDPLDTGYRVGPDESFEHLEEGPPAGDSSIPPEEYLPISMDDFDESRELSDHDPHVWIGISLILGFILMYLIDTIPQSATAMAQPQRFHISLNQFSFNRSPSVSQETAETPAAESSRSTVFKPSSTTVGLVIHAAADGIALGASSTTSSNLSFIIFIALMIHKAPAAFGLTSVLLKQGLTKRQARVHLIVFSLAAPVGALLTWLTVHLLGLDTGTADAEFATGVLLLFSGGTFLYVAMHTMQTNGSAQHEHGGSGMNGYASVPLEEDPYATVHGSTPKPPPGPSVVDTFVTVGGMLLPLLTQWGHVH